MRQWKSSDRHTHETASAGASKAKTFSMSGERAATKKPEQRKESEKMQTDEQNAKKIITSF
jgi:hypothetical protein